MTITSITLFIVELHSDDDLARWFDQLACIYILRDAKGSLELMLSWCPIIMPGRLHVVVPVQKKWWARTSPMNAHIQSNPRSQPPRNDCDICMCLGLTSKALVQSSLDELIHSPSINSESPVPQLAWECPLPPSLEPVKCLGLISGRQLICSKVGLPWCTISLIVVWHVSSTQVIKQLLDLLYMDFNNYAEGSRSYGLQDGRYLTRHHLLTETRTHNWLQTCTPLSLPKRSMYVPFPLIISHDLGKDKYWSTPFCP